MSTPEDLPQTIGRYQVVRLLGEGAMGSVVLAEDPKIKRKVAIKLVKLDAVRSEADRHEFLMRFQREAEVSGLLNHPGIVAIYDVGEVEGLGPFLAMEYVAGKPLDLLIKTGALTSIKEKLRIAASIAEALDHAHAKGIVHRDVKPGNVMVGEDGRVKLMDFGIAKREDANLTQTGTFLGTPSYASPEQIKEGMVDARSDIFSFGVLAFELLSGQSPFPGNSINTILYRIVNEAPVEVKPPITGILPEGWRRVFDRVLAKQPADRHASCTAFIRDLLEAVVEMDKDDRRALLGILRMNGDAPMPPIVSRAHDETMMIAPPPPSTRGRMLLMAAAVVVVGVFGWFLFRRGRDVPFQIVTQPPGAQVFVNDLDVGRTPISQPLRAGDRLRFVLKGYTSVTYTFTPGEAPSAFPLAPVISDEVIDSVPQGASVVLNGQPLQGATPLKVRWNQGVKNELSLKLGKQVFNWDFEPGEVPGGHVYPLQDATTADTRPEPSLNPAAPGYLRLAGDFPVRVKVDGKEMGELGPGVKLPVPPGTHKLELANAHYFYHDTRVISVPAGQPAPVAVPALAKLTIDTFPGTGRVSIDGQDAGIESDGSSVDVAMGRHVVTIRGAAGPKTETVEITGDKHLKIQL